MAQIRQRVCQPQRVTTAFEDVYGPQQHLRTFLKAERRRVNAIGHPVSARLTRWKQCHLFRYQFPGLRDKPLAEVRLGSIGTPGHHGRAVNIPEFHEVPARQKILEGGVIAARRELKMTPRIEVVQSAQSFKGRVRYRELGIAVGILVAPHGRAGEHKERERDHASRPPAFE